MYRVIVLCASLSLGACSGAGDGAGGGGGGGKADEVDDLTPPDVEGRYQLEVLSQVVSVPAEGHDGESQTYVTGLTGLVDVTGQGDDLDLNVQICALQLPALSGRDLTLSDSLLEEVPPLQIQGSAFLDEQTDAPLFATEQTALVLGVHLDSPLDDAMPTDDDDPRVFDQDQDDNPGVTVRASGFGVYVALRLPFSILGEIEESGAIGGECELAPTDIVILGDGIPFVDVAERVEESRGTRVIESREDTFSLVPSEALSCAEIL